MPYIMHKGDRVHIDVDQERKLIDAGLTVPHEDDNGEEVDGEHDIDPDLLEDWPDLDAAEVLALLAYQPLLEHRSLQDTAALDLINFMLSTKEFSVLRDRTGRKEVRGATWARH